MNNDGQKEIEENDPTDDWDIGLLQQITFILTAMSGEREKIRATCLTIQVIEQSVGISSWPQILVLSPSKPIPKSWMLPSRICELLRHWPILK